MSLFIITAKLGGVVIYVTAATDRSTARKRVVSGFGGEVEVEIAHWSRNEYADDMAEWQLVETYQL